MKKIDRTFKWAGYPVPRQILLNYVHRLLEELPQCHRIHYSFMPDEQFVKKMRVSNFRFRLSWVFQGELITEAAFEKHWEKRQIHAHELFLSGTGGGDAVHIEEGDCQVLAILFYAQHTRLVYSEFQNGRVISNPYFHTTTPDSEISKMLLDVLNHLTNEPEAERSRRVIPVCRALLEQLILDINRENLDPATPGNLPVYQMITFMQLHFHQPINCASICEELNINRTYASELFHQKIGRTIKEYLLDLRLEKAVWLLQCYKFSLEEVAQQCGFSGANYFIRIFKAHLGCSPGDFRRRHQMKIASTTTTPEQ